MCFGVSDSSPESGRVHSEGRVIVAAGRAGGNIGGDENKQIREGSSLGEGALDWEATILSTIDCM